MAATTFLIKLNVISNPASFSRFAAFNDNTGIIKDATKKIREADFDVWIDDFGSGYSSLNTIAEYEFDVLKLDMVFLRGYEKNPKSKPRKNDRN